MMETIINAANGNEQDMVALIQQFAPLLHRYARKLNYEDAYFDLRYEFIKLIYDIAFNKADSIKEKYLVAYIQKSVIHAYYSLADKNSNHLRNLAFSDLTEGQNYYLQVKSAFVDEHGQLLKSDLQSVLTKREYFVIDRVVLHDMSASEVAKECGVTRQSVNQTKKRALAKLKKKFIDDEAGF